MNLFSPKASSGNGANVKDWIREALGLGENTVVMVSELQCMEEGCPPIETVIAVMGTASDKRIFKIHKPIDDVTELDVVKALEDGHEY